MTTVTWMEGQMYDGRIKNNYRQNPYFTLTRVKLGFTSNQTHSLSVTVTL